MSNVVFLRPAIKVDEPVFHFPVSRERPPIDWPAVAIWVGIITLSPLALVVFAVGIITIINSI